MKHLKDFFEGRTLLIATRHGKEEVIAPLLEKALGVRCVVPPDFDTDLLGTFSGEVARNDDPLTTVQKKAALAMEKYGADLAVANEGSFGPHPVYHFVTAGDELVWLCDRLHGIGLWGRSLDTHTNFNAGEVTTHEALWAFAQKAGFPDHGIILRPSKDVFYDMEKGIRDAARLEAVAKRLLDGYGRLWAETDMRAMHNPTRMQQIGVATQRLLEKLAVLCPACHTPGFAVSQVQAGLPCAWCGRPTRSTLCHIHTCGKCGFTEEKMFPAGKTQEDPGYCDFCNP